MTHNEPDTVIRYTLDGTDPDGDSPVYEKPIPITHTTVVKARAFRRGVTRVPASSDSTQVSEVMRAVYTPAEPRKAAFPLERAQTQGLDYAYFEEGYWPISALILDTLKPVKAGRAHELFDLSAKTTDGGYAFVYTGFLKIDQPGIYSFHSPRELTYPPVNAGYQLRVFIGDQEWYPTTRRHNYGVWSVPLEAGLHALRVVFVDQRNARMSSYRGKNSYWGWMGEKPELKISGPDLEPQRIPAAMLYQMPKTYSWKPTGTGDWATLGNWNLDRVPASGDQALVNNGGTAVIGDDGGAASHLQLGQYSSDSGHIVQNGGTLAIGGGPLFVGRTGEGTYTLNGGLLDYNGGEFAIGRFGDATAGAASFYQNSGEVQAGTINMTRAGSLYEISGGTFTGGQWFRNNNTTIRVIGGAADIDVSGMAFRNDGGGAYLEFVLDNSSNHISTVRHTGSGLRRNGHLVTKLNGGVLLFGKKPDDKTFNMVRSDSAMAGSWASTPRNLWTYSGNVRDGGTGPYCERITLAAAVNKGTLGKGSPVTGLNDAYGYVSLSQVPADEPLEIQLDVEGGLLKEFTNALTAAGITWEAGRHGYDVFLSFDPSVSGARYFAWDLESVSSGMTVKRVEIFNRRITK